MAEMKNQLLLSIKHLLQSRPPISLTSSPSHPETPVADPSSVIPAHHLDVDVEWAAKVIGFCFSWAVAIAFQSPQNHEPLPISFHFLSHAIVIAVTLLYLSKYMYPKCPKLAQVLEHVGVLFGVIAFFLAITIPFPLCIKLIYWTVYAFSLLAIFLCNRP